MTTTHASFLLLPLEQQVPLARQEGTFVGWRWETADIVAGLYRLPAGFFCELCRLLSQVVVPGLRTFTGAENLDEYADSVDLKNLPL